MGIFDRFKKPDGLGEKLECGYCHKKMYMLKPRLSTEEKLQIIDRGYRWCTVFRCTKCGSPVCDFCMRIYLRTNCEHQTGDVLVVATAYK